MQHDEHLKPIYYTTSECVQLLRVKSRTTLWNWIKAGNFPRPVQLGPAQNGRGAVGFLRTEVDQWNAARAAQRVA